MQKMRLPLLLVLLVALSVYLVGYWKTASEKEQLQKKNLPQNGQLSQVPQNKQEPQNAQKKPGAYFPLTKGSSWKYQGYGNEYAAYSQEVLFVKDNLTQVKESNGGTVIARVFKTSDDEITEIYFQGEAYDPVSFLEQAPNRNTAILKAPLRLGLRWGGPEAAREIVDVNATVTTLAGKFENCIKVKITGQYSTMFEYYKEGVGLVKKEFFSEGTTVTSELESFTIGK